MAVIEGPHVLVVAGSDSSGGAGIARDIETISAIGARACVAITAITVQTHRRVGRIQLTRPTLVADQMRAALSANPVAAVKIGMLGTEQTVRTLAAVLRAHSDLPIILDPVLGSSSGSGLLTRGAVPTLKRDLLPLCTLVTPNLPELAILAGTAPAKDEREAVQQGYELLAASGGAVLVKGGHMSGPDSTDILIRPGHEIVRFSARRSPHEVRGTGCMLASAIAACLARDMTLEESVRKAKSFVLEKFAGRRPGASGAGLPEATK